MDKWKSDGNCRPWWSWISNAGILNKHHHAKSTSIRDFVILIKKIPCCDFDIDTFYRPNQDQSKLGPTKEAT